MFDFNLLLGSAFFLLAAAESQLSGEPHLISPIVIGSATSCPVHGILELARRNIQQLIATCGGLGWTPVASLNMEDSSQQCPPPWVETNTPARSCFAPQIRDGCEGVIFPISGMTYSRVCGRAVGYTGSSPDGFVNRFGQNAGTSY